MGDLATRIASVAELHIRVEKLVRSFDLCISAVIPGMTYSEFRTLGCISRCGPVSLKQISDLMALPKTTMHYTLNKLESAGLIERALGKRKGTPVFTITPAGRHCWEQASAALLQSPWSVALFSLPTKRLEQAVNDLRRAWAGFTDANLEEAVRQEAGFVGAALAETTSGEDLTQRPEAGRGKVPAAQA